MVNGQWLRKSSGFTLIELILYITLVAIFITGAIFFAWDIVYGREKAFQQQIVEQNGRAALSRISYEIRRASDINTVSATSIELENGANDTTVSLVSGTIQITTGGAGPYALTSNQVEITNLTLTDLSSSDENTKNIEVTITIRQAQTAVAGQFEAQTTMSSSVELNSQFNDARALLMDASNAILTLAGREIDGTTLQNSKTTDITIEKMTVTWTGGVSGSLLDEIEIDGLSVWSTSANSGDLLDIIDVVVSAGAAAINVDKIKFEEDMSGATITVTYTMSDGSTTEVIMDFS